MDEVRPDNDATGIGPAGLSRRAFLRRAGLAGAGVVGAGALSSLLAACGSASSSASSSGGGNLAKGAPFVIGSVMPLTGLTSAYQYLATNGIIAQKEINSAGGVMGHQIKFQVEDDRSSPANEPAIMRKFKSAGINYVLGPFGSSLALASLAVTKPAGMIQSAWDDDNVLGDPQTYPNFYQVVYNTRQEATLFVNYLAKTLGLEKIGLLQENTAFGEAGTKNSKPVADKAGVHIVGTEVIPIDANDLTPYVGKLKAAGAEGVIAWIAPLPTMTKAFQAMASLQWHPPITGHSTLLSSSLFNVVSADALNKVYAIQYKPLTWVGQGSVGAQQVKLAKEIVKYPGVTKVGPSPVMQGPYYDWLHILKGAIESAKTFDTKKVQAELNQVSSYDGVLGTISFSSSNHTGIQDSSLTLGVVGTMRDPRSVGQVFVQRAPGL